MSLSIQTYSSIADVPKDIWDGLVQGHSCTFSHAFWQIIERSQLNDFSYRYAIFFTDDRTPVALASFYTVTTDMAIFGPIKLRRMLEKVRRVFPNFMKLRILECGTPVALNSPPFVTNGKIPDAELVEALDRFLTKTARSEWQLLIVVRDFEENATAMERDFQQRGYCIEGNLPNNYMDIVWATPQDYVDAMKSYYRSKLLKHLRRAEDQSFRHELVSDFGKLAEVLCEQWMIVHENAKEFQREILTPEFYRGLSTQMGANSKVILFYQQDVLIGHVLLLMDGDLLRWLYFGRNVPVNDSLYIYASHKVIEAAITLGAKRLEMGLTTYPIKQDLGSQVTPLKMAIKSSIPFVNPLVKFFYPLMNSVPVIENRSIFKSANAGEDA